MAQFDIKRLAPIRALTLRFITQNHLHFARVTAEIRNTLIAKSFTGSGYPIQIIYGDRYAEDEVDTEFAIPVEGWTEDIVLPTFGTMTVQDFAEVEAATYLHHGSPDTLNEGLGDLQRWVAANGYRLSGSMRLIYLKGLVLQRLPTDEWLFEVQHPLEKVV